MKPPVPKHEKQVPAYEIHELARKRTDYCFAVPILNEGERILSQLAKMQAQAPLADIVIADGGSTDGATQTDRLRELNVRTLLVKTGPGKLGAQIRMAFDYGLAQGYKGVVLVDGNDKDDTTALPLFLAALAQGHDFVQGSRYVPGGRAIRTPHARHFAVKLLHAPAVSIAARHRFTDTTNGFRGYSRHLLEHERVQPLRDVFNGYELHYYLAIRAARLGLRVCEVPVTRTYPPDGSVPTKITPFRGNLKVLRALLHACTHRFDP